MDDPEVFQATHKISPLEGSIRQKYSLVKKNVNSSGAGASADSTKFAQIYYRKNTGYMPSSYSSQGFVGIGLGFAQPKLKHWDEQNRKGFAKDCSMNFLASNDCTKGNAFAPILQVSYLVVGIVKFIFTAGSSESTKAISDSLESVVGGALKNKVEDDIKDKAKDELKQVFSGSNLEGAIKDKLTNNLKKPLIEKMGAP